MAADQDPGERRPCWARLTALIFILLTSVAGWWAIAKLAGALRRVGAF